MSLCARTYKCSRASCDSYLFQTAVYKHRCTSAFIMRNKSISLSLLSSTKSQMNTQTQSLKRLASNQTDRPRDAQCCTAVSMPDRLERNALKLNFTVFADIKLREERTQVYLIAVAAIHSHGVFFSLFVT